VLALLQSTTNQRPLSLGASHDKDFHVLTLIDPSLLPAMFPAPGAHQGVIDNLLYLVLTNALSHSNIRGALLTPR